MILKRTTVLTYATIFIFSFLQLTDIVNAQTTHVSTFYLKKSVTSIVADYVLNVSVNMETYTYYKELSHKVTRDEDLVKFVTPGPVKPIADLFLTVYNNTEDLVNGILMIAHQIKYVDSSPKYAVEYLVDMSGDCEVSYLVASLTLASNVKTVLLLWKLNQTVGHVNVGVALNSEPKYVRRNVYYVVYDNVKYYVAETTGNDWENGWRVGELPSQLEGLTPKVIPLSFNFDSPAGVVSAVFNVQLYESSISVNRFVPLVSYFYIEGVLNLRASNQTVNLYVINRNSYKFLSKTVTDNEGRFVLSYLPLNYDEVNYGNLVLTFNGNEQYKSCTYKLLLFNALDFFVYCPFYILVAVVVLFSSLIKNVKR